MISDPARRRRDRDSTDPATVLACVWIAIVVSRLTKQTVAWRARLMEVDVLRATVAGVAMVAEEWSGYGHGEFNVHPDSEVANSCELCKIVRQISEALRGEYQ